MDRRGRLSIKVDALQRLMMINVLSGILPLYIVTEYPKSGGTWLAQMLSAYLDVPFPRNRRPKLESCIMHGHYLHTPFMRNVICLVRDGRDVVVSAYYHMLFPNDKNSPHLVEQTRKQNPFLNYDDITSNLPQFIEYLFAVENKRRFHFSWAEYMDSWLGKSNAVWVKYEDLLNDAALALQPVVERLTGSPADMARLTEIRKHFSFAAMKRKAEEVEGRGSFLRKGIAGDWKNNFDRRACEVFDHFAGDKLVALGYEEDRSWVLQPHLGHGQG